MKTRPAAPRRSGPECPGTQRRHTPAQSPGNRSGASDGGTGAAGVAALPRVAGQAGGRDAGGHRGLPPCNGLSFSPRKGGTADSRDSEDEPRAPFHAKGARRQACPRCEPRDMAGRRSRGAHGGGTWGTTSLSFSHSGAWDVDVSLWGPPPSPLPVVTEFWNRLLRSEP